MIGDPVPTPPCVVCGSSDRRSLSTTALADGTLVTVCGSHELAHRRAEEAPARSIPELARMTAERRTGQRRGTADDELAEALTEAFSMGRRARGERRS